MAKITPLDNAAARADTRELSSRSIADDFDFGIAASGAPTADTVAAERATASRSDALNELVTRVNNGRVTVDQAVDELRQQIVAAMGNLLSEGQKTDLAELLRSALSTDPALAALQKR